MQVGNRTVPLGPGGEIVPGATPTAVQLPGSAALARLSEGLKARGYGDSIADAEQAREAARAAAVRDMAPENADTSSLGDFFRRAQADQDTQAQNDIATQSSARDTALAQQPGAAGEISPYQAGQQFQGSLSAADTARKQAVDTLFNSLRQRNPVLDVSPLQRTTGAIEDNILASKAGDVPP
jgi:hypothetical protein